MHMVSRCTGEAKERAGLSCAGVKSNQEMTMKKTQTAVNSLVIRAASSATLMAVVVTVVGAGKKFV